MKKSPVGTKITHDMIMRGKPTTMTGITMPEAGSRRRMAMVFWPAVKFPGVQVLALGEGRGDKVMDYKTAKAAFATAERELKKRQAKSIREQIKAMST